MNYGLYLSNYGVFGSAKNLEKIAVTAEEAGWDGMFLWDHINPGETGVDVVDPWIGLTAIASVTKRIKFGTTITPIPRRRPRKLARETVSLDHYSNGRLILGVGIGAPNKEEFGIFDEPLDPRIRGEMLDEGLDILTGLWEGKEFSYDGKYYRISEPVTFFPPSLQQPRIPIWVGGFWNYSTFKPFRRAAKFDGCIPLINMDNEKQQIKVFQDIHNYIQKHTEAARSMEEYDLVMIQDMHTEVGQQMAEDLRDDEIISWWLDTTYRLTDHSLDEVIDEIAKGPI